MATAESIHQTLNTTICMTEKCFKITLLFLLTKRNKKRLKRL